MPVALATGKLNRRSTVDKIREAIYAAQRELMDEYDRSGKIRGSTPEDMDDAYRVALKEAYRDAKRYAGKKVPEVEKLFPKER